jgi:uncharacterized protein YPO0396
LRHDLKDAFRVSDDVLDQMVEIVESVTDAKSTGVMQNAFVVKLLDLLAEYGGFFGEKVDAVEVLCNYVDELEGEIEACEAEAEQLRQEIAERMSAATKHTVMNKEKKTTTDPALVH